DALYDEGYSVGVFRDLIAKGFDKEKGVECPVSTRVLWRDEVPNIRDAVVRLEGNWRRVVEENRRLLVGLEQEFAAGVDELKTSKADESNTRWNLLRTLVLQILITTACIIGMNAGYQSSRAHTCELIQCYRQARNIHLAAHLHASTAHGIPAPLLAELLRDKQPNPFSPEAKKSTLARIPTDTLKDLVRIAHEVINANHKAQRKKKGANSKSETKQTGSDTE
ncbi:MAG TPA: hypothetical protein VK458_15455, partial [Myxococcaceae bacterium]|nr:hypothetical protein [Myxococcaceae bacterium]